MKNFEIQERGYQADKNISFGNKFLIGNGYMGVRGTLEESRKDKLPAINLSGLYDQADPEVFREPINAPNGCYTCLRVDGTAYTAESKEVIAHEIRLDDRYGIFTRQTTWHTPRGNLTLTGERFVSMQEIHMLAMRFTIQADFHADVELITGIDQDVWELNGPHLQELVCRQEDGELQLQAKTVEQKLELGIAENIKCDFAHERRVEEKDHVIYHRIFFITQSGQNYQIEKFYTLYTQKDCDIPLQKAKMTLHHCLRDGWELCLEKHKKVWEALWKDAQVEIVGDDEAMKALNYSIYQLQSIAPRYSKSMSIPARGLSGQTYKGAIFWDTEMFMLDFFLFTDLQAARSLVRYRIDALQGALDKAASYGYQGAFYAWESQEGGYEACSDYNVIDVFTGRPMRTFFRDKQIHISAAVVYGIMRYVDISADTSILDAGGICTILECARFYYSILLKKVADTRYELHDVIGPDEYHERVNNNAYTNRMVKYTFEQAQRVLQYAAEQGIALPGWETELWEKRFADAARNLYQQQPNGQKLIEQFDGYLRLEDVSISELKKRLLNEKEYWGGAYGIASQTKVIKQADVVAMLNLFAEEYDRTVLEANWNYYEPRTEHGSSLSAGMYAILACRLHKPEQAYPFFLKSATADLQGDGKEWAGLLYIGGTHPAAAGAAYMVAIEGFAGIRIREGQISCEPNLPAHIQKMKFPMQVEGKCYEVEVTKQSYSIAERAD